MKQYLLLACLLGFACFAGAQTTPADSLREYTGKYKFPDGTPFPEVKITLENGSLMANSVAGTAELKRKEGDIFEVLSYGGLAIFKRGEDKKVNKVQVQVNDLDVEGVRTEDAAQAMVLWRYHY